jgi:phosphatidylinositol alpha-1,6-mannosyltransferase
VFDVHDVGSRSRVAAIDFAPASNAAVGSGNNMIGLFPGIGPIGGIPASGLDAWQAFQDVPDRQAIVYGADDTGNLASQPEMAVVSAHQFSLVCQIVTRKWNGAYALFWHVGLLKLLPFLRGFRGRVVLFLHGIEIWRKPSWVTRRLLRRVDHFLSNSEFTWKRFVEVAPEFGAARHDVVHLGMGDRAIGEVAGPGDVPAAVIVGRIAREEDYKGHRELIAAWLMVRETIKDAELWVVGDGNLRAELQVLARSLGLAEAVRFLGRASEAEKLEAIRKSRCLAMPSRGEGFGLVYLEAMRLGRPCLVSDCDAGREVVNPPEAGLAVDQRNPRAIAIALCELLTLDGRWHERSNAARQRFENYFTAAHFSRRLVRAITRDA